MLRYHFFNRFSVSLAAGWSDEYQFLTCYADYRVQEYLLGSGPDVVTVAYDHLGTSGSYDLYTEVIFCPACTAAGSFKERTSTPPNCRMRC